MTQRVLAESIGVGVPHVSKIEACRENPSDDLLARVARLFQCDYEELLLTARRLPADLLDCHLGESDVNAEPMSSR